MISKSFSFMYFTVDRADDEYRRRGGNYVYESMFMKLWTAADIIILNYSLFLLYKLYHPAPTDFDH